jgi:hypothetical protein
MLTIDDDYKSIIDAIEQERSSRTATNARWLQLWSLYKTEPLSISADNEWQSRLNDGRIFEIVETVASYLRSALFFSDSWVTLEATEPELGEILPLVTAHFRKSVNCSNLKREFRIFLRQLLLLGYSAMTVDYDGDKPTFETINSYDIYIESGRRLDENSFCFRDSYLNYATFVDYADAGIIEVEDVDEAWEEWKSGNTESRSLLELNEDGNTQAESVKLTEYWCPWSKRIYRFINDECVSEEDAKHRPWIIATIYELPDVSYGLGLLDSSLGLILENNFIMNRRLDNMAISVDNMWMFVDDGVTNPDDITSEPGKVITVGDPGAIQPMYPPTNNFNVTYQESSLIDSRIEKNTGTGALISSGQYRSGDRVTAEEINAVKEAGGTRLTDLYEHIESTFIIPLLKRTLDILRKYKRKAVVKLASTENNNYDYFQLLPKDLDYEYDIVVNASQSIINRDRNIRRIQEFLAVVNSVPQFAEMINYRNLYVDMLTKFGFDDPMRYLAEEKEEPEQPQQQEPTSMVEAIAGGAGEIGGGTMQDAVAGLAATGELGNIANDMVAGAGTSEELDPIVQQEQQLAMQQQI